MLLGSALVSLDGAEYVHKGTRIEGDFAYLDFDFVFVKDGVSLGVGDVFSDDPTFVWRDRRLRGLRVGRRVRLRGPRDLSSGEWKRQCLTRRISVRSYGRPAEVPENHKPWRRRVLAPVD